MNKFGKYTVVAILGVALNYLTNWIAVSLSLPLFLDTWGTSASTIFGGWPFGVFTGVAYNLISAATLRGWEDYIWFLPSILVATLTWMFWQKGWINIKKFDKLFYAGVTIGVCNAILVTIIGLSFFGSKETYPALVPVFNRFVEIFGSERSAFFLEHLAVEIVDKTISLFLAAYAISLLCIKPKKKTK